MAKLKKFSVDRLVDEFDWMGRHKLGLITNCDANYGIFERDVELTELMVKTKRLYGYPNKFRASYAKNSGDRVYRISKILNNEGMCKGVTLSFQSMDEHTLEVIKRKNIGTKVFQDLMKRYRSENIPTYSEIIIGMPGETYDTFADGLDKLMSLGQHNSIHVYTCTALPNSELSEQSYMERHSIKTVRAPSILFHCTPSEDQYQEYDNLVVETATLPKADWLRCQMLSWAVQCFHCLGLTQSIAVFLNKYKGISYRKFYETLLLARISSRLNDNIPREILAAESQYCNILEGRESGFVDQRFGNIRWPVEEGSFLKLIDIKETFYRELRPLVLQFAEGALADDLIEYQKAVVIDPQRHGFYEFELGHNLHECIQAAYLGEDVSLETGRFRYKVNCPYAWKDLEEYAKQIVWHGRKGLASYQHIEVGRI